MTEKESSIEAEKRDRYDVNGGMDWGMCWHVLVSVGTRAEMRKA